jgi:antitoxin component YwqK of YwqJK toxin-antitoxin module
MKTLLSKFSVLSTLVLISFLFLSFSQGVVWLDENHNQVTQDNGKFYRPFPEKKRNVYLIVDFYKNGTKYREGKAEFHVANKEVFKGFVTYFYPEGSILKKEKYKDGLLDGPYKEYYPTGEVKVEGVYGEGFKQRAWKIYYKTGKIKTKGKYRNDKKVGEWTTFYRDVYYPNQN